MSKQPSVRVLTGFLASLATVFIIAGCSGDDDGEDEGSRAGQEEKPATGTFVGKLRGSDAFVAVVAASTESGQRRDVKVYVCDARRVSEWFPGSAEGDRFVVTSDDGDAEVSGTLRGNSADGTVELSDGRRLSYTARRAASPAGFYNLTVRPDGRLQGTSASGEKISGKVAKQRPGRAVLTLPDGTRLEDTVTSDTGDVKGEPGQVRLIVLANGSARGAGKAVRTATTGGTNFTVRYPFD